MKESSERSEKSSVVSYFTNKAGGGASYSRDKPDPDFLKRMEEENANLKQLRRENKKRMK